MRILLVDDERLFLDTLTRSLVAEAGYEVVGSITEIALADRACGRLRPEIVLLDICAQGTNAGLTALQRIKEQYPHIKVVVMTGFAETSFFKEAQARHADGFIYKNSTIEELKTCLVEVMAGQRYYAKEKIVPQFAFHHTVLTERELEVLRLYCQSKTREEIAQALYISPSTVNYHVNNMLSKTGYKKLLTLAIEAVNKGYIHLDEEL